MEQTGEHNHTCEIFTYGLPQRCKDEIVTLLTQNKKIKPNNFVRITIEKKYNVTLYETERGEVKSFI